ncbi:hypothetical protein [Paracoccus sp. SCSIO 75233]|uniref:hypothetical protein n=1 Tax=Paracoccus sp. SCSIO 75233 TaxID=3017782 RepID=UPI0022F09C3E|nr:hypothetical protein [Paracoccus sp. SCSIO 75233]WBU51889.1 hypothetical protein PAF12_08505 [Paracoccus sp. SCSIO 75233]
MSDKALRRRSDEIERRKAMFGQARAVESALRTITDRQPGGQLTRGEAAILAKMIRQNLCACVRKERHYRPTRAMLAKQTGYSQRTVSKAITRLKEVGIVAVARYAKGGRLGDKGKGLATEFRAGCLQFIVEQMEALGYHLPKSLRDDLASLGRWAAAQVGESTVIKSDTPKPKKPTGKKVPGTLVLKDMWSQKDESTAPVATADQLESEVDAEPPPAPPGTTAILCAETGSGQMRNGAPSRPPVGTLALLAYRAALNGGGALGPPCAPPTDTGSAGRRCRDPEAYDPEAWR